MTVNGARYSFTQKKIDSQWKKYSLAINVFHAAKMPRCSFVKHVKRRFSNVRSPRIVRSTTHTLAANIATHQSCIICLRSRKNLFLSTLLTATLHDSQSIKRIALEFIIADALKVTLSSFQMTWRALLQTSFHILC